MDSSLYATVIIGTATVVIAFIQLDIMRLQREIMENQTNLMERQTALAVKQDEILGRRGILGFQVTRAAYNPGTRSLELHFVVQNNGNKTVDKYYWKVAIPTAVAQQIQFVSQPGFIETGEVVTISQVQCRLFQELQDNPLFPSRHALVVRATLTDVAQVGDYNCWTQLVWEDGVVPGGNDFAPVSMKMEQLIA